MFLHSFFFHYSYFGSNSIPGGFHKNSSEVSRNKTYKNSWRNVLEIFQKTLNKLRGRIWNAVFGKRIEGIYRRISSRNFSKISQRKVFFSEFCFSVLLIELTNFESSPTFRPGYWTIFRARYINQQVKTVLKHNKLPGLRVLRRLLQYWAIRHDPFKLDSLLCFKKVLTCWLMYRALEMAQ